MKLMHVLSTFAVSCCLIVAAASSDAFSDVTKNVDNSAVNQRDQSSDAITAGQQARGSKSDVEMTRQIRRALTKDDSLSTYAKNVKIITLNGAVTLRGPVKSSDERAKVASIAQSVAGSDATLNNNLEVKN